MERQLDSEDNFQVPKLDDNPYLLLDHQLDSNEVDNNPNPMYNNPNPVIKENSNGFVEPNPQNDNLNNPILENKTANGITEIFHKKLELSDKKVSLSMIDRYTEYTITDATIKENPIYLSQRKYEDFYDFYETLGRAYPYGIFPQIPSKTVLQRVRPTEEYFIKRKRNMEYFLNYLYNHPFYSKLELFRKFIRDGAYNALYFNSIQNLYEYPNYEEYCASLEGIKTSFSSMYSKISKEVSNLSDQAGEITGISALRIEKEEFPIIVEHLGRQDKLLKIFKRYQSLNSHFESMKLSFENLKKEMSNEAKIYQQMSLVASYQEAFPDKNTPRMVIFDTLSNNLNVVLNEVDLQFAEEVYRKFLNFSSIIKGILDSFERYKEFLKTYNGLVFATKDIKKSIGPNALASPEQAKVFYELEKCEEDKEKYEELIFKELDDITIRYKDCFKALINDFQLLLRITNSNEEKKIRQKDSLPEQL